jgi:tyrosyl-tRNA synthetase
MTLYEDLKWRGLVQEISDEKLIDKLNNEKLTFYIGTDPTADSMHIGHYSSFLISKRLAKYGHKPILLVGGATGLIGDPKPTAERPMISKEEVKHNFEGLKKQAEKIFGFEVVNNYDWIKDINVIDFLRDYGKYFNVSYMLAKDKVKKRMETGITYAEFSYMILQALDFMHLYETKGVTLQVAGSDQWGNITSGIELTRRKLGKEVYGMIMPLVTDSNGVKFGKTEGNALWLDKNKTSSYELYQYLINLEDSMIIEYLKKLTFLSKEEIEKIEKEHLENPHLRTAHKALARCVITDLHGKEEYEKALKISEALFSGKVKSLSKEEILMGFKDVPSFEVKQGTKLIDMLISNNICSSKREAREFLNAGSISINDEKVKDEEMIIDNSIAIEGEILVIKRGKKKNYIGILK